MKTLDPERVLVLAPTSADRILSQTLLTEAGFDSYACCSLEELTEQMKQCVGAVVLTDDALARPNVEDLVKTLRDQPAWSDIPVLILSSTGEDSSAVRWKFEHFGNVTILERPVRVTTLVSAIRAALRARRRQYELRDKIESLQRSEKNLSDFFENAAVGLHWASPEGIIQRVNQTELKLLGYSREEFVGRHIREFHVEPKVADELFQRLHAGDSVAEHECQLRCKDGSIRHVLISANVHWENGKFLHTRCFTRDITRRVHAEELLQQRERLLRLVIDALPAVVTYVDCDTRLRFFNRTLCEWFHLDPSEIQNRRAVEVLGEAAYEEVRPMMERAFQGESVTFSAELPYSRGGVRAVEIAYVPDRRDNGTVEGYVGLIHDVTQRRRAEAALQESEERFRTIADNIAQFAWTADKLGWATWYNKRWYEYTGATWEQMKARGWESVVHPDHVDRVNISIAKALEKGEAWEDTYPIRGKDGQYRWFLSRGIPIRDSAGNIRCWFGTNTDVTEQRATEEALRISESRMRQLLSLMPMAVYTCDAEGRITFFNRQAAELWGREPRIGASDEKFCGSFRLWRPDGSQLAHAYTPMAEAIRSGRSSRNERVIVERPDGSRVTISANIDPLYDREGRRIGAINVFEDVTERVAAEEALKTDARRKDEFLAMLAHELRNPLAPIRTGLQLLHLCRDDPETMSTTLEMMNRQLQQLVRLIDDLLDVSRITRGKIELRKEPCELATILSVAIESSRPFIEEAGVELTVSTPKQPVELHADAARLSQVFSNLLTNSAKYTDRGGHIWLTAELDAGQVLVRVRDDGIGIELDKLTLVFEMFTQVHSQERSRGGLGIGLSLVHALVARHGGSVEARSDGLGKGSEFVVRLPVVAARTTSLEPQSTQPLDGGTGSSRVLVVDDNVDAAKTMCRLLELMNHEVRMAHDGLQALDVAEKFRPDIVLLDIGMPKLDGYEAARQIRSQPWGEGMTLVALTGWGQEQDRQRSAAAGFDRHCVKPVDVGVLRDLLDENLTRS